MVMTLPTGSAADDRIFIVHASNNTTATAPTNWTVLAQDVQVGPTGTAPGAGTGRRFLSVYYRDYDGAWTMPTLNLASATQNTHAATAITLRKGPTDTWDTPTWSGVGNTSGTVTAYSVTIPSFTTTAGGLLIVGTATNDNVTSTTPGLTQTGATFANLTERSDTGSATGNDVSIKTHTANVTTGAAATLTHTQTLSALTEGGSGIVQQTITAGATVPELAQVGTATGPGSAANLSLTLPTPVAADDVMIAHIYIEASAMSITPPSGWAEITPAAESTGSVHAQRLFWVRAAGGETGSVSFTHASAFRGGYISRYTGCVTTGSPLETPAGTSAAGTSVSGTTAPAVSDTTTGTYRLLIYGGMNFSTGGTWTPPTGFTERFESGSELGSFATKYQTAAGATGSIQGTYTTSSALTSRLIALKPTDGGAVAEPWWPKRRGPNYRR